MLVFNFVTLFVFVIGELFIFMREQFIISRFHDDDTLADDNLTEEIQLYPRLKRQMHLLNQAALFSAVIMMGMEVTNFVLSAIVISRHSATGSTAQARAAWAPLAVPLHRRRRWWLRVALRSSCRWWPMCCWCSARSLVTCSRLGRE